MNSVGEDGDTIRPKSSDDLKNRKSEIEKECDLKVVAAAVVMMTVIA